MPHLVMDSGKICVEKFCPLRNINKNDLLRYSLFVPDNVARDLECGMESCTEWLAFQRRTGLLQYVTILNLFCRGNENEKLEKSMR